MDSQIEQIPRNHIRGVAGDSTFVEVVSKNRTAAELFDPIEIRDNLRRTLQCVFCFHFIWCWSPVNERVIENLRLRMSVQGADMIGGRQTKALVRLGHEVADVNLDRWRIENRLRNSVDEQVGDQAREQGTGADCNDVGMGYRLEGLGQRLDVWRN